MKFFTKYDRNPNSSENLKDNELVVDRKGYLDPQQYYYSVLNGSIQINQRNFNNGYDESVCPYDENEDIIDQMSDAIQDVKETVKKTKEESDNKNRSKAKDSESHNASVQAEKSPIPSDASTDLKRS